MRCDTLIPLHSTHKNPIRLLPLRWVGVDVVTNLMFQTINFGRWQVEKMVIGWVQQAKMTWVQTIYDTIWKGEQQGRTSIDTITVSKL